MGEQPPESLEMLVLDHIKGAMKSREVLEAEWPEDAPPLDDDRVLLSNWVTLVERQGATIAQLAAAPPTRRDLMARLPGAVERAPAWLAAQLNGEPMTYRVFANGLAQTVALHRDALERIVAEQVGDPEPIEELLAEAPVPAADSDEERGVIFSGVARAISAHTEALADLAYDLEQTVRRHLESGEQPE